MDPLWQLQWIEEPNSFVQRHEGAWKQEPVVYSDGKLFLSLSEKEWKKERRCKLRCHCPAILLRRRHLGADKEIHGANFCAKICRGLGIAIIHNTDVRHMVLSNCVVSAFISHSLPSFFSVALFHVIKERPMSMSNFYVEKRYRFRGRVSFLL